MDDLDPLRKAAPEPLATVGEGCVRRFDHEVLTDELGCSFAEAQKLWCELFLAENKTPPEGGVVKPESL